MNAASFSRNKYLEYGVMALFAVGFVSGFFPGLLILHYITLDIPVVTALVYIFLFRHEWLPGLVLLAIPVSFPVEMGGGVMIDFPSEFFIGIVAMIFVGDFLYRPGKYDRILCHPLVLLLLAEAGWMIICSFFSNSPTIGYKRSIVRMSYLLAFVLFFAGRFKNGKGMLALLIVYGIGCIIPVFSTLYYHSQLGFVPITAYWMPKPFFNDHTIYGACLAFLIPGLLVLCFSQRIFRFTNWQQALLILLTVLLIIAEILSFSRAAWVSLVLAGVFAFLIRVRVQLWMIITFLFVFVAMVFIFRGALTELAKKNESVSSKGTLQDHILSVTNIQSDASNLERINRWNCAMRMAEEKPLFGFGPGMYQYEYGRFQDPKELTSISTFHGNKGNAHSEFFSALSETGFPGFILFTSIMFAVIGYGLQVIYSAATARKRKLATAILLGLVTFYVHGFFNAFLDTDKMAVLVFGSISILLSLHLDLKNEQAAVPSGD